jgi:pimeloyl-ACP methyl ester carboxylesterase
MPVEESRLELPGSTTRVLEGGGASSRTVLFLPSARIMRWEGVGHSPHIEAPERFALLLDDFLESTTE